MTDIEVTLADLGEIATRELVKEHKPYGLKENRKMAKRGGKIAKNTRDNLEKELVKTRNQNYPLGRIGDAYNDIGALAEFLLSNKASWITGSNYVIDGGKSLF